MGTRMLMAGSIRRVPLVVLLVVLGVPLIPVSPSEVAEAAPPPEAAALAPIEVTVTDAGLAPRTINAVAGQSIRIVNDAGGPVTIAAPDGTFDSGPVPAGGAFVMSIDGDDRIPFEVTGAVTDVGLIVLALAGLPGAPTANARQAIPALAPPPTDPSDLSPHPSYGLPTSRTQLIVLPAVQATVGQIDAAIASVDAVIVAGFTTLDNLVVSIPDAGDFSKLLPALATLRAAPGVEAVAPVWEADELRTIRSPDVALDTSVGPAMVRALPAWNYLDAARNRTGTRPDTLVIDTGFEANHNDLRFASVAGSLASTINPENKNHGTHVAGIIGAKFDNDSSLPGQSRGVNGLDPLVQLHGTVFSSSNYRTGTGGAYVVLDQLAAFDAALSPSRPYPQLRVINASFGVAAMQSPAHVNAFLAATATSCGPVIARTSEPALCTPTTHEEFRRDMRAIAAAYATRVLDAAATANVIVVRAAGNSDNKFCEPVPPGTRVVACSSIPVAARVPIDIPSVVNNELMIARDELRSGAGPLLVVGALDENGVPYVESQSGADLVAPGVVVSTLGVGRGATYTDVQVDGYWYGWMGGTSMAAPHVTGAISFLLNTLQSDQYWSTTVNLVKATAVAVPAGGPPLLDMFNLLTAGVGAARLVDVNDAGLDGSQRVLLDDGGSAYASAGPAGSDLLGSLWAQPDQVVDMRDFRRFRDGWLHDCATRPSVVQCGPSPAGSFPPIVVQLDGPGNHPMRDTNLDGCVNLTIGQAGCANAESRRSRFDYNGDGALDIDKQAPVMIDPNTGVGRLGSPVAQLTDLDVFRAALPAGQTYEGWSTSDLKNAVKLRALMVSGDVHVRLDHAFPGASSAKVWVEHKDGRLESTVTVRDGSLRGIFTVPVDNGGSPVKVWASAVVNGKTVVTPVIEVTTLHAGQDVVVSPCAAKPQVDVEATYAERADLMVTFPGCGRLPAGQKYADGKVEFSVTPGMSGAPTVAPVNVDLQGKLIARTTLTDGTVMGDWTVTARYVQPTNDGMDATTSITTVDPIQVRYTWRARLVSYTESGSNNWPNATSAMPDCDLIGTLCIDSYTAASPGPGASNYAVERSGTLQQTADGVLVTETVGGGSTSVTQTYVWSNASAQSGTANKTNTIQIAPGQTDRYVDHLLPPTTEMRAFTDSVVLAGLGAVSELGYQGQMFSTVSPGSAPDSQVLGVPPEFFLEPDASGDSIKYSATPGRPVRFVRTGINAYAEYVACPVIDRTLDAEAGYLIADPSQWVAGAADLGRDPVYDPGDIPMPITTGRIVLQVEFAATASADGTAPPAPTLPDCAAPSVPTAAFELLPQPDGSLDEGDTLRFSDRSIGSDIVSYQWSFGDGRSSTASDPVIGGYPDDGNYNVTLTVTTSRGLTATTTKQIAVSNVAPTIEADPQIVVVDAGQPLRVGVVIDDRSRTDRQQLRVDASVPGLPYQARTEDAGHVSMTLGTLPAGQHRVTLSVTDPDGARATTQVTAVVLAVPQPTCPDGTAPPCTSPPPVLTSTCGPTISNSAWESDLIERLNSDRLLHVAPAVGPSSALTNIAAEAARRLRAGLPIDLTALRDQFGYSAAGQVALVQLADEVSPAAVIAGASAAARATIFDPAAMMVGVARVGNGATTTVIVVTGSAVDCDDPPAAAGSAPALTIAPPVTVPEGTNFSLGVSVSDVDGDLADVAIDLGGEAISGGGLHRYVQDGTYTVTITAVDEQGNQTTRTATIVVTDAAPVAVVESQGPFAVGQKMILSIGVVDRGEHDVPISFTVSSSLLNTTGQLRANGSNSGRLSFVVQPSAPGPLSFTTTFTTADGGTVTDVHTVTVLAAAPPPPPAPPNATLTAPACSTGVPVQQQVADYLTLSNMYRTSQGVAALQVDPRLTAAAERHLADMIARQFFAHVGSDGSDPSRRAADAGYAGGAGENLISYAATPAAALAGWQMSPKHHHNLLDPSWQATGIAVGNSPMGVLWVQVFGDVVGCPTAAPPAPTPEVLTNPFVAVPPRVLSWGSEPDSAPPPAAAPLPATGPMLEQVPPTAVATATVSAYVVSDVSPLTGEVVTVTNRSRRAGVPISGRVELPGGSTRTLPADGAVTTRFVTAVAAEIAIRVLVADGEVVARGAIVVGGEAIAPTITLTPLVVGTPVPGVLGGPFQGGIDVVDVNASPLAGRTVRLFLVADPTRSSTAITDDAGHADLVLRLDVPSAGDWQVRADVLDDTGQAAATSNVVDVRVTSNLLPIADPGGPYVVNLGDSVTFDATRSYDPGVGGAVTAAGWDLDGDGQYGDLTGLTAEVQWPIVERLVCRGACRADRDYPIGVQVLDEVGASSTATTTLRFRRDFGIFVGPESQAIPPGGSNQFLVSIVTTSGFDEEVDLTAPGLPSGVTVSFSPARVRPAQQSTMTVTLASTFQGITSFDLNVRGVSRTTGVERIASPTVSVVFGLVPVCTTTFRGQVLDDETGLPVEGVAIQNVRGTVLTGVDGRWQIDAVPLGYNNGPQQYYVYTSKDGYWSSYLSRTATCGVVEDMVHRVKVVKTVPIRLHASVGEDNPRDPSRLVITDGIPAGATYAGYQANWVSGSGPGYVDLEFPLATDNLPRVANFFYADAPGYWYSYVQDPPTLSAADVGGPRIDVYAPLLRRCSARISGGTVRSPDGIPVSGATVVLSGTSGSVLSGSDGRFGPSGPIELGYRNTTNYAYVTAYPPPGAPYLANSEYAVLDRCGDEVEVDVWLRRQVIPPPPPVIVDSTISGTVTDFDTGAPLDGVQVYVNGTYATTAADGSYSATIPIGPAGTVTTISVGAFPTGYWDVWIYPRVTAGQPATVDFRLRQVRFGAVEVVVRDLATGLPLADADVYVDGRWQTTGADGRLRWDPVRLARDNQPVLQYATATRDGYWTRYVYTEVRVGETSFVDLGLLAECQPAQVRGLVLDAVSQLPLEGATVYGPTGTTTTAADGTFTFTGIRMQSQNTPWQFTMTAAKTGYITQSKSVNVFCGARVVVDYGPQPVDPGVLEGTVTRGDTGAPVVGAVVGTDFGGRGVTDAAGFYRITSAPTELDGRPRDWGVTAQAPFDQFLIPESTTVTINAGQTTRADLVMDPMAPPNRFPVASTVSPVAGPEGSTITLDASASSDPDGDAITFAWDLDGDGQYDDATGATTSVNYPVAGSHTVRVKVTDAALLTGTAPITVVATNVAPVVTAGGDVTITAGQSIDRTVSFTDPGADTWTGSVTWDAGAPGTQQLTDRAFHVTRTFTAPGVYVATVEVADTKGGSGSASFTVTVEPGPVNEPPIAAISGPSGADEGTPLTLDGSGSHDPDGTITGYAWTIDGVPAGDQPTLAVATDTPGTFAVALTVTDDGGSTGAVSRTVTIANVAPTLTADVPPTAVRDATVTVPITATDPGRGPLTIAVDWGDGSPYEPIATTPDVVAVGVGVSASAGHVFAMSGTFTVMIAACDPQGGCGVVRATIEITDPGVEPTNRSPQARLTGPTSVTEGSTIALSAAASSDPDGDPLTYEWTVDGVSAGTDPTLDLPALHPASRSITVTVRDDQGGAGSISAGVEITNLPPTIAMTAPSASLSPGQVVAITIDVTDPGDRPLTLAVDTGSGPATTALGEVVVATGTAGTATVQFSTAAAGSHTVKGEVCDESDACATATVTFTVTASSPPPAPNRAPTAVIAGTTAIDEGGVTELSGAGSSDPDGDQLAYAWTVDGAPAGTAATVAIGPRRNGVVTVGLTVSDGHGASATTTATVVIANLPPTLFASGPAEIGVGESWPVDIDARDPWSDVIEVLVEWGDGTSGRSSGLVQSTRLTESVSRQHVYGAAGTYRMTVTACDADGACRQAFLTVSVRAAATPTPVPPASGPTPPPVGTLPATGSQTAGPLRLAMLTLIAGVALSALGARRRRPA